MEQLGRLQFQLPAAFVQHLRGGLSGCHNPRSLLLSSISASTRRDTKASKLSQEAGQQGGLQDASMRDDPQNGGDEFDSEEGLLGPDEDICPRRISRNFRMFCSACKQDMARDNPSELIECSCCHRVFHSACYESKLSKQEGIATPDSQRMESGHAWYHTSDCERVHTSLRTIARLGERPLQPMLQQGRKLGGTQSQQHDAEEGEEVQQRSWRLIMSGGSGLSAVAMGKVHGVLSQAGFKYGLSDLNSFDAAALIRQDGLPVCAAVLDLHGADAAELFVVGTRRNMRNQGLCRQMVSELSATLGEAGVRKLVVPVDEDEEQTMWKKLGFQPLEPTALRQLGWTLPAFSKAAVSGSSFVCKTLQKASGKGWR